MIKDVTQLRDDELRRRFSDIMDSGVNRSYYKWETAVHLLAQQSAPRFYISADRARTYVSAMRRGTHHVFSQLRQAMVRDLAENYDRIKLEHPEYKEYEIWYAVVESPAKSFYLLEKTIKYIVYDYLRPKCDRERI